MAGSLVGAQRWAVGLLLSLALAASAAPARTEIAPTATAPAPTAGAPEPTLPGAATPEPDLPDCDVEVPWQIELSLTGGLAGVQRRLLLDDSGRYLAEDLRQERRAEGEATAEFMQKIRQQLPLVCAETGAPRLPACADCFIYSLHVRLDGTEFRAEFNDVSLGESPMAELVGPLAQWLTEVVKSP
jgi:hypothetical protein